jgi:hypothetical protein
MEATPNTALSGLTRRYGRKGMSWWRWWLLWRRKEAVLACLVAAMAERGGIALLSLSWREKTTLVVAQGGGPGWSRWGGNVWPNRVRCGRKVRERPCPWENGLMKRSRLDSLRTRNEISGANSSFFTRQGWGTFLYEMGIAQASNTRLQTPKSWLSCEYLSSPDLPNTPLHHGYVRVDFC